MIETDYSADRVLLAKALVISLKHIKQNSGCFCCKFSSSSQCTKDLDYSLKCEYGMIDSIISNAKRELEKGLNNAI